MTDFLLLFAGLCWCGIFALELDEVPTIVLVSLILLGITTLMVWENGQLKQMREVGKSYRIESVK